MKNISILATAIGILVHCLVTQQALAGENCKYSNEIDRVVDINSVQNIEVEAGAGSLKINGSNRKDVRIQAVLCSSSQEALAAMDLSAVLTKNKAHFKTIFPRRSGWRDVEGMSIDLVLSVPSNSQLLVSDSSGEAEVRGVASLNITDSSGRLKIEEIDGDLQVLDSSGELDIQNVKGDISLTDSSGGIYISNVGGSLTINADSSGGIEARKVAKDILIKMDSSGDIDVRDVGGNFTVRKDTSGGISYDNVAGKVSI